MTAALENITVVLVEPATPANVGSVARVLKNTGISRLALVNPAEWDTPEARWTAHASEDILDQCLLFDDLQSAVSGAHLVLGTTHRQGRFRKVTPDYRAVLADTAALAREHEVALVFGREKDGLWRRELMSCHQLVTVPSAVPYPSFNLSHAVLLIVHELFLAASALEQTAQDSDQNGDPITPLANAAEVESVHDQVVRAMRLIGFRPYNDDPSNFSRVLKRFLTRPPLERRDAMVIHRICGQIRKFAARTTGGGRVSDQPPNTSKS